MTKVFLITSGHNTSTFDLGVYYGLALKEIGIDVQKFRYDVELRFAMAGLRGFRGYEDEEKFTGEAVFLASRAAIAAVAIYKPDYVISVTGVTLFHDTLNLMANLQSLLKCPFRTSIILTESPYLPEEELNAASNANCIFTNERNFLQYLRGLQPESYYLPHAYAEQVHYPAKERKDTRGVFFCGSGFPERLKVLRDAEIDDLELLGYFPGIEEYAPSLLPFYNEGELPNAKVADRYRESSICLNFHRESGKRVIMEIRRPDYHYVERGPIMVDDCYSLNNRAMEIAACGAFQLCDSGREELHDVFGDSVATFDGPEDLGDKVRYYLSHEEIRERMARVALERVRGRTYVNNAKFIMSSLDRLT